MFVHLLSSCALQRYTKSQHTLHITLCIIMAVFHSEVVSGGSYQSYPKLKENRLKKRMDKHWEPFWMSVEKPSDFTRLRTRRAADQELARVWAKTVDTSNLLTQLKEMYETHEDSGSLVDESRTRNRNHNGYYPSDSSRLESYSLIQDEAGGKVYSVRGQPHWRSSRTVTKRAKEVKIKEIVKGWMIGRASCSVKYVWEDLGIHFWPRYIRRGFCTVQDIPKKLLRQVATPSYLFPSNSSSSTFAELASESSIYNKQECSWPPGMHCVPGEEKILKVLSWQCRPHNPSPQPRIEVRAYSTYPDSTTGHSSNFRRAYRPGHQKDILQIYRGSHLNPTTSSPFQAAFAAPTSSYRRLEEAKASKLRSVSHTNKERRMPTYVRSKGYRMAKHVAGQTESEQKIFQHSASRDTDTHGANNFFIYDRRSSNRDASRSRSRRSTEVDPQLLRHIFEQAKASYEEMNDQGRRPSSITFATSKLDDRDKLLLEQKSSKKSSKCRWVKQNYPVVDDCFCSC